MAGMVELRLHQELLQAKEDEDAEESIEEDSGEDELEDGQRESEIDTGMPDTGNPQTPSVEPVEEQSNK